MEVEAIMSKLFIYSNSFVANTILYQLPFLLNIHVDEVILLKENHPNEVSCSKFGVKIKLLSNISECIKRSDIIFILKDDNTPLRIISKILDMAREYCIKCYEIENPWSKYDYLAKEDNLTIDEDIKKYPVVLSISLGPSAQQYCLELLLNKILSKHNIGIKQVFSPTTYSFLSQLVDYRLTSKEICMQFENVLNFQVVLYAMDIGVDFNNIRAFMDTIKTINPDFVIIQTNIRFCEYEIAKMLFKYGCFVDLDLIVKSHYNTVTLEDANIIYCSNNISVTDFVKDLEQNNLEDELEFKIFSKLTLPQGVLRL